MSAPIPSSPFRERLITYLLPYFLPLTSDFELARTEALETLESYGARTRSEMINAMRIIALSFTSMDLLAVSKGTEMPPDMRLHYVRQANSLARTCQQNENALAKRLAVDPAPPVEQAADPIDDVPDIDVEALIEQTHAQIIAYRKSIPGSPRHQLDDTMIAATRAQDASRPAAPA